MFWKHKIEIKFSINFTKINYYNKNIKKILNPIKNKR